MGESGLDLVALAPSDNLRYVLGFAPHYDERACMLLVTPSSAAVLMPSLNAEQAAGDAPELELVTWSDDAGPADAMRRTLAQVGANGVGRAGIDPEMRADHLLLLQDASPDTSFVSADVAVRPLREVKSDGELRLLQAAADAADVAMRAAFSACRPGATELHVADAAAAAFRAEGCEEVVFTIVGAGANGAFPPLPRRPSTARGGRRRRDRHRRAPRRIHVRPRAWWSSLASRPRATSRCTGR